MLFLWIKAFHVTFMVAWLAGLLCLPWLFAAHAEARGTADRGRFSALERQLSMLMSIAALGTIAFGVWMLAMLGGGWIAANGWFHAKLALVVVLIGYHGWCQVQAKKLREERATGTPAFYRMMGAVPAVILLLIMLLIFIKPF
ncbi:CopD family protein [Salinisphaera sp. LB1]|uniref:CopD family protein n=1 Tax=Salinisphaera sp. LB1 TaxID=2183911 RepID=UPI000D705112|nr:CopD family protein [Salinisphaera sp. LB1]AWN15905.1 Protoporphyrinogen IX oxidase HemJ [Salinisphaera sp. LB1]